MPSSSAQNLIITNGNLLHFSAWHKMILTGIQHSNLLHLSAWHKMTITGIQHVYLTSCQIPLANNKHQLQKYRLRVSVVLQGAAIWPLLTAYALGYGNTLTRAIQFVQEHYSGHSRGSLPQTLDLGKRSPTTNAQNITCSVCFFLVCLCRRKSGVNHNSFMTAHQFIHKVHHKCQKIILKDELQCAVAGDSFLYKAKVDL